MSSRSTTGSPENAPILIDPSMLPQYHDEDEIDLVSLWISLAKQKKIFLFTSIIVIFLGMAVALTKPIHYTYSTLIEIGASAQEDDSEGIPPLIQSISAVKSEVQIAFINQALREFYAGNPSSELIKVTVNTPKDTNLIILSSEGDIENEVSHLSIQNKVVTLLVHKHSAITEGIREGIKAEKLLVLYELEDLEDEILFSAILLESERKLKLKQDLLAKLKEDKLNFEKELTRLDALRKLLSAQYQSATRNLDTASKNQQLASQGSPDTPLLILLTSELQEYRTNIAELDERLNIKLPAEEQELKQKIVNNLRSQENQVIEIKQADFELSKLQILRVRQISTLKTAKAKLEHDLQAVAATHAVLPPARSLEPNPRKRLLILAVSIVLALFAGIFAAMMAAFFASVKEKREPEEVS